MYKVLLNLSFPESKYYTWDLAVMRGLIVNVNNYNQWFRLERATHSPSH